MSTDQAEAAAPAVEEAPAAEAKTTPKRDVDDFLADLDDVLATSAAPTIPAPATEQVPDAAATMPDVDLDLDVVEPEPEAPAAPAPAPEPTPAPHADWWNDVYKDDRADQDTFTGNAPSAPVAAPAPPRPDYAPDVPAAAAPAPAEDDDQDQVAVEAEDADDEEPAPKRRRWSLRKPGQDTADDEADDDEEDDDAPAKAPKVQKTKGSGGGQSAAGKEFKAAAQAATSGFLHSQRGGKAVFAASAFGLGWGLHLDDRVTDLMVHAHQYAIPITGCALLGGLVCLATGTKGGAAIFVGSLGLITALTMVDPARVVGGGVALGCFTAYRFLRRWLGNYGDQWPWKAVTWFAFVPTAASTVAVLLYGTN
ncbi:hypothetical protein [Streptomyces sp. NPDC049879]|uniref:hypothetical protein n=1 Tax=Streptomyces sp. NPDC049879 TaxID=3365598 RepID=UPI003796548D